MESYVECLVPRKPSGGMKALKVGLIAAAVFCFLLGLVVIFFMLGTLLLGAAAYFVGLYASVEYEYLYVDREISVDRILNKTRRKKADRFDVERMEILAPVNSWHLDDYRNRQLKQTDYSSGRIHQPDNRYVMIYDGGRKVILEPNEAMVRAIQSVVPRKVFMD